ncbi:PP2C family protein-serine/threonine phosphatase [Streptomyces sannanensis]|uniref:PP2C family protein-serine/threonine phosphatase n=1 Tax=Streptomyces sannanensis TaxID=285536 RepID=A0ABP6SKT9_9ACTN
MPHGSKERTQRPLILHRSWTWWLPFVATVAAVALELLLHGAQPVSFLLIGVPPLAAATRGPRGTAASTVMCLLLEFWMASRRSAHITEQYYVVLLAATLLIGIAGTALSWQRERAKEHLIIARSVAEAMQLTLLRPVPYQLGPVRAAGFYSAGEGGMLVGGDLYDLRETPFGVRVIIGDVRGKGLDAVQTVSAVLGSFRVYAHESADLAGLAERLELSIALNKPGNGASDAELFVTALVLKFPPAGNEVRIVDRGHPPPVVIGPKGARRIRTSPALPLGLGELAPGRAETTAHPLHPGEILVVFTDGVSEARNAEGVFYPVLERLAEHFGARRTADPEAVASFVQADAERWSALSDNDDQALLALSLSGPAPSTSAGTLPATPSMTVPD